MNWSGLVGLVAKCCTADNLSLDALSLKGDDGSISSDAFKYED